LDGIKACILVMEKAKKHQIFVGIDISKGHLDYAVLSGVTLIKQDRCSNDPEGINTLIVYIKSISRYALFRCLFCMEHTGLYSTHLIKSLSKLKLDFVVENPLRLKKSLGIIRGKSDKIDALRIAQYAYQHQHDLHFHQELRPVLQQLAVLLMLRNKLTIVGLSLKMPLNEIRNILPAGVVKNSDLLTAGTFKAIKADLAGVEHAIDHLVTTDPEIKRLMSIILSVPQIGRVTAIHILLSTNEFKNINCPKKFASYSGVAPFPNESGTISRRSRVSPLANKRMKALLHICALGAIRNVPELRNYYVRKTENEGKSKMLVINAIRFKLILRVFTCVKQNRKFIPDYLSPNVAFLNYLPGNASIPSAHHKTQALANNIDPVIS
jgi:transposase